jgi:hypothetical protein
MLSEAKPQTERRRIARVWFYLAVVVLVASVWGVQVHMYHKIFSGGDMIFSESSSAPSAPSDWQKMAIQAMTDTNSLLTTLGTALLGALGLLMSNHVRDDSKKARHMWAAFLGAVGGCISLYFGYVSHLNLLAMISNGTFSTYDPVYLFSSHAQFYTLLAGAFFFADFAVHDLSGGN